MDEGGTNLFWAERYGQELGLDDLWVKMCGNSHTGSFKDLGMTVLVSVVKQMIADGVGVRAVACASTGDTSAALAAYAASAGIPAIVFLPSGLVTPAQLVQPLANGAKVLAIETDFDGCMKIVQRVAKEEGVYLANSMNSLRIEGQKTISLEIVQQFDWQVPDWMIIPGGNLGNVSALGAGFDLMVELGLITKRPAHRRGAGRGRQSAVPRLHEQLAVRAHHGQPDAGLGDSHRQSGLDPQSHQHAAALRRHRRAGDARTELADAAARADMTGLFNCPHTGVALAALEKLVARGEIKRSDRVVVISTATGLKFTDFKIAYHTADARCRQRAGTRIRR